MSKKLQRVQLRQGDVYLQQIDKLPAGAKEIPLEGGRIVLAHGEATGHAHAIDARSAAYDDAMVDARGQARAKEIADATIALASRRARLFEAGGDRFLVVEEPVSLTHEEHTAHEIPPGIYEIPVQCEFDAALMRRVQD